MLKFGQALAAQLTSAEVVGPQTLFVLAVTVMVTTCPGFRPVTVYDSPASVPAGPVTSVTVYEVAPATGDQLKVTEEVVAVPQVTIGVAIGFTTLMLWLDWVELHPFSLTLRVMVFVPPVGQDTV